MVDVNERMNSGSIPVREHRPEIEAKFKNNVYCRYTQDDQSRPLEFEHGIGSGNAFFAPNDDANLNTSPGQQIEGNAPNSLKIEPSQYMQENAANTMPAEVIKTTIGVWGQAIPSVSNNSGLLPIRDKANGVDTQYKPKQIKNNNFSNDPNNFDEVKVVNGAPIPKGFPGILTSTVSADSYEFLLYPAGNMLAVNHQNADGSSTRVFDVNENGFLDVTNAEAAALHTIFAIMKDENNRKIVCINGQKSGQDDTGFFGIKLDPKIDGSVVPGSDNGVMCYGSWLKNGPFTAGAENDKHAIGINEDGKKIHPLHFDVDKALFFRDTIKDGPIKFSNLPFPVITEESEVVECELAFDTATGFWRIFANVGEQNGAVLGRVRWNFSDDSDGENINDLSEAQIIGTTQEIWIDAKKSDSAIFRTAGNSAVFVLSLVQKDFTRPGGGQRDLYRVSSVFEDLGQEITYVQTESKNIAILLEGQSPFENPQPITTLIGGSQLTNRLAYKLPSQWITSDGEDYRFLEVHSISNGIGHFYARPIKPTPKDANFFVDGIMESSIKIGNNSIATYKIDIQKHFLDNCWNILYNGIQAINVQEDLEKSILGRSTNTDESIVCIVNAYDENTGIAQCTPIFDRSENPLVINVGFKEHGKNSFIKPEPGQIEPGQNSFIVAHRVGFYNSSGGGSGGGENVSFNGPELYTEDATKVSFFSFYEKKNDVFSPVDIVIGAQFNVFPLPENVRIITTLENPNNDNFVDVGARQALVYNVIDTIPVSVNAGSFSGVRILALSSNSLSFPETDIRLNCDAAVTGKLFSVRVVPGAIVDENGNIEIVHIISSPGAINFGVTCCEDQEEPPTGEPPEEPPTEEPPDTEEPPEEPEETENPDGTTTLLFCPGTMSVKLEDGATTKILERTAGGDTGTCQYSASDSVFGPHYTLAGNENGWVFSVISGFGGGAANYSKPGAKNPYGIYQRDGSTTLFVEVF